MISLMDYSVGTYEPNGQWTVGFGITIVVAYNTILVNSSMVPTGWQNLTDPHWNGKIAIDDPKTLNVAGSLFAHLYPILGARVAHPGCRAIKTSEIGDHMLIFGQIVAAYARKGFFNLVYDVQKSNHAFTWARTTSLLGEANVGNQSSESTETTRAASARESMRFNVEISEFDCELSIKTRSPINAH